MTQPQQLLEKRGQVLLKLVFKNTSLFNQLVINDQLSQQLGELR